MTTFRTGERILADIVTFGGVCSREQVRVERMLDDETVLVTVESSIATPVALLGITLPISTSRVVNQDAVR